MHPTDTLLSLSHARIARAAAAGPRRATQPTALTDRQHLAGITKVELRKPANLTDAQWAERLRELMLGQRQMIIRLRAGSEYEGTLAERIAAL